MLMLHKAVSVSLPSWKANVGYEEGEDWVLGKMKTGYPRFARPYRRSQWRPAKPRITDSSFTKA